MRDPELREMMKTILVHISAFLALWCTCSQARPPEEAEFLASKVIGEHIADWLDGLEKRPYSVAIYNVRTNFPLEQDYATVVETSTLAALKDKNFEKVFSCGECRIPNVAVKDDKVIITKGVFDIENLKSVGKKIPVETFLAIDIFRTKLSVIAEVTLFENGSGNLVAAERIKVPALSFVDAAAQFMFTVGPGKELGAASNANASLPTAINVSLLEDIGFAKAGLNLGGVFGGQNSIFYLNPSISFRGRFGNSYLGRALTLGVGYGFATSAKGISFRGAFDVFLGSVAVLGLEGIYFLPDKSGVSTFSSFAGFHVGIALGR